MMKVLLVNKFHYRKGGAETYYLDLGESLAKMGHEVAYFAMQHPSNLPCKQERYFVSQREYNAPTSAFRAVRDGFALLYSYEARAKFEQLCEDFQPDVIHLNNVHRQITMSILDAPYIREHQVPVLLTAHDAITVCPAALMLDGQGKVCTRCIETQHYRHCILHRCIKGSYAKSALATGEALLNRALHSKDRISKVIAPSHFLANMLVQGGWDAGKVTVLRNPLPAVSTTASIGSREHTIVFAGRLSQEKGVDSLITGFSAVVRDARYSDWKLLIAGDGPLRQALEDRAKQLGIADAVEFLGYLDKPTMMQTVINASFAAMPSVCNENMPYGVLEAMQLGTPVIASAIGGIQEIITQDYTGFFHTPGAPERIASALRTAMATASNEEDYSQLQRHCIAEVRRTTDQDTYMDKLVRLYNECCTAAS